MQSMIYKLFIFASLLFFQCPAFSQLRSFEDIRNIAQHHYQESCAVLDLTRAEMSFDIIPSSYLISLDSNIEIFYLCNTSQSGFVIVSADERMPEILGYSDTTYDSDKALPDGLLYVLNSYRQFGKSQIPFATRAQNEVSPLLTTSWDQSNPYNQMCPLDGNTHSLTGCVATAAAQIMKYYEWPAKSGNGTINYTTETKKLKVNIDLNNTTFAWNMMKDAYVGNQFSQWEATAVSRLMYAVGASCLMDYSKDESGTTLVECARGMNQYFGYDKDLCMLISNYVPTAMWHEILIKELNESRPVLFSGNASGKNVGHAFVLDGFQQKNGSIYYHVNWGWSGSCNGYYLLNNLKPSQDGKDVGMGTFNDMQMMLLNFQPEDHQENALYCMVEGETISKSYFPSGEPVSLTLSYENLACFLCRDFSGVICLDLYDETGRFVKTLKQQKMNIPLGIFMENGSITLSDISIKDGKYTLRLSLKETDGRIIETIFHNSLPVLQIGGVQEDAIMDINSDCQSKSVFDIKGQIKQSADNQQLSAGFYIIDGKKVLIRE